MTPSRAASPRRAAAAAGIAKAKAFKRPSLAQMNRLWDELRSDDRYGTITTGPTNNNLKPNSLLLQRRHFVDIYRGNGCSGVYYSNVEVYLQFVCEYVNRANKRNAPEHIPVCAAMGATFFRDFYLSYLQMEDTSFASAQLTQNGLGPANFLQLRHLFLPDRSLRYHIGLIVISPHARTVDYLDSAEPLNDPKMGVVFKLLSDHLGDLFVPHEWKVRQGHSPQQSHTRDCAIYTCLNAMLIAFGYPIEYKRSDMMNRRYRMATDLLNGKNGMFYMPRRGEPVPEDQEEFHYELTGYWTGPKASDRSRGFQALSITMLYFLQQHDAQEKRARRQYRRDIRTT